MICQKLSDQVFGRLKAMIEPGEVGPSELLASERALMDRFEDGRPAVREATQQMLVIGSITIAQGRRGMAGSAGHGTECGSESVGA